MLLTVFPSLSDLWMPLTQMPTLKLHSTLCAPWLQHPPPPLLFEGLHCYSPTSCSVPGTQDAQTISNSGLSIYNACIPGVWTATRIIKGNMTGLGRQMLLFNTSKTLVLDLLRCTLQTFATCRPWVSHFGKSSQLLVLFPLS